MTEMQKIQLMLSAFFLLFLWVGVPNGATGQFCLIVSGACFALTLFQFILYFIKGGLSKCIRWAKDQ